MQYRKNAWMDFAEIHRYHDPVGKEELIKFWECYDTIYTAGELIKCSLGSLMVYLKNAWMDFAEIYKYLDPVGEDERVRFWQCCDLL